MQATEITIENFRRFESFHCRFDPRFTLLMGANGTGKTSVLRAMHVVLASIGQYAGAYTGIESKDSDVHRRQSLDPAQESWRIPVYPCRIKLWMHFGEDRLLFGQEATASHSNTGLSDEWAGPSQSSLAWVNQQAKRWFDPSATEPAPLAARYSVGNAARSSSPAGLQKPFDTKQSVWKRFAEERVDIDSLTQWFQYNELRSLQEGKEPLVYRRVKQAVLAAIHAEDIRFVVRDGQLMLRHEGQGWRAFEELSDGQLRLAAIFCDLALRCASLNSHMGEDCITATPGIVTIDELDLHLHPSWQRSVVGDLLRVFPKLQFIVTSHSPFLLQAAFEHGQVVDMRTGEFVTPTDPSIEDIAEGVMGVPQPQRGQRFLALQALAARYLELLESKPGTPEQVAQVKTDLDQAMAAFANEPASAAWLAQWREAVGL